MADSHSALIMTLGGVAVFMLGMNVASENLQKLAADRIRDLERCVDDINKLHPSPDVVVHTGDVVHKATAAKYSDAVRILQNDPTAVVGYHVGAKCDPVAVSIQHHGIALALFDHVPGEHRSICVLDDHAVAVAFRAERGSCARGRRCPPRRG